MSNTNSRIFLSPPFVGAAERAAVARAFDSGYVAPCGPQVDEFERRLAKLAGRKYAVAVSSGTAAIDLLMAELGVDETWTVFAPTLTFIATVGPAFHRGAKLVFVDSDATGNIDVSLLEDALESLGGNTKILVIGVDLYGNCCNYGAITKLCRKFGAVFVTDAAEAVGAKRDGRPAGSAGLAVAADGTASGGEIVLAAPVAKGGRCPKVIFEVDADDMANKYKDGSWSVLLLDTRRWGADGSARPAGTVAGKVALVNATGAVSGGSVKVAAANSSSVSAVAAAVASAATAVPEGAPNPAITGIRVEGANVFVTVKGTVPYLQYGLSAGDTPGAVTDSVSAAPQTGASAPDEEIVLVAPAKAGGAFFKVGRK